MEQVGNIDETDPKLVQSAPSVGVAAVDEKLREWFEWDKNLTTRNEITELAKVKDIKKLEACMLKRLDFGTAGLRGRMGAGYGCMNDLVIIQTTQGLAIHVLDTFPNITRKLVVVGYDGRYNSKRFAQLTTAVLVDKGIHVLLFSKICPTPFVPFAVNHFGCQAGIMITASHNPKEDNGYKVYWDNGAQIVAPIDKNIQQKILNNLKPSTSAWNIKCVESGNVTDPLADVMKAYFDKVEASCFDKGLNAKTSLKFTYTPMHGVGQLYMEEGFKRAGLTPFISVQEQREANPEFPTVKFPNPEEGKSALDLSIKTAMANSSSIILANDPDADRLAVAERTESGEWKVFTGNELGPLLGWWCLFLAKKQGMDIRSCGMISSTVSSKFLETMAKKEGFQFYETLTGFKWMGNKAVELANSGVNVIFAFEEAIGFMCGTNVLDKDGVSAGIRLAELAVYLNSIGTTLQGKLMELYNTYGLHICDNSYYICHEPKTIEQIFAEIREHGINKAYPDSIMEGKYVVSAIRDLTVGYDSSQADKRAVLPVSKSSQMITLSFSNGLVATLRTSGTEPKIKYYTEMRAQPEERDWDKVQAVLKEMINAIIIELLQPQKFGLIERSN